MRSWIQQGNRWLSNPYQIVSNVRGYEAWLRTKERYCILARELVSLSKAKEFCESHARGRGAAVSGAEPAAAPNGIGG